MAEERKRKTNEEKIDDLNRKLEQLKAQKREIVARENKAKRAARTRRLIQIGAISEKYFACEDIEPEQYEALLNELVKIEAVKVFISKSEKNNE